MEPVEVVKQIYEAFGRGDIPEVLSRVTPDVSWVDPGFPDGAGTPACVVDAKELPISFRASGKHVELTSFEAHTFVTSGPDVVVFGGLEGRDRHTGARFRSDLGDAVEGSKRPRHLPPVIRRHERDRARTWHGSSDLGGGCWVEAGDVNLGGKENKENSCRRQKFTIINISDTPRLALASESTVN